MIRTWIGLAETEPFWVICAGSGVNEKALKALIRAAVALNTSKG